MSNKILCFGAHPDDVELAMGGTIKKHIKAGDQVTVALVTIPRNKETRLNETKKSAELLGFNLLFMDVDPKEIAFNRSFISQIDKVVQDTNPDIVYTHWNHDTHQDHQLTSKATLSACRKNQCSVYMFAPPVISGVTTKVHKPQKYVDITNEIEDKMKSLGCHKTELELLSGGNVEKLLEGVRADCRSNGLRIRKDYAEVFEVVKIIN